MNDQKKISELEKEVGFFLTIDHDPEELMNRDDYLSLAFDTGAIGVAYEDRVEFLKKNDYEVTRKNLLDTTLTAKQVE